MNYDNEMRGVLFKNDKQTENAPDYKGKATIQGHEYSLSAWINTSKAGDKYMSITIQEPYKGGQQAPSVGYEPPKTEEPPF